MSTSPPAVRTTQHAWRQLLLASTELMHGFEAAGDFGDLTTREYDVLRALVEPPAPPQGLRLGALAELTYLPQPSMSRLVERLERRGLVARVPCEEDGRGVVVALTEAGRALQREVGRRHVRSIQAALSVLPGEDLATLTDLLTRLRVAQHPTTGDRS